MALLNEAVDDQPDIDIVDFLSRCPDPNGGYGGGPGQMPHLATTYDAVNSLITISGERALSSMNRKNLDSFLIQMKDLSGGFKYSRLLIFGIFIVHDALWCDVRVCYTTLSVKSVLNILDNELVQGVGNYIISFKCNNMAFFILDSLDRILYTAQWVLSVEVICISVAVRLMKAELLVNSSLKLMLGKPGMLSHTEVLGCSTVPFLMILNGKAFHNGACSYRSCKRTDY
ncbi:acyltransferase [Lithospermum erythrorhizon]|uniref:Acyltransferase n=1 Tax=Lithospermum erythrorhizon TaxID=34254 RepID=A0AAV3NQ79_LITER